MATVQEVRERMKLNFQKDTGFSYLKKPLLARNRTTGQTVSILAINEEVGLVKIQGSNAKWNISMFNLLP